MANDLKALLEADGFTNVVVTQTPTFLEVVTSGGPLGQVPAGEDSAGNKIFRDAEYEQSLGIDEDMTAELAASEMLRGAENTLLDRVIETCQPRFGIQGIERRVAKQFGHRDAAALADLKDRAHRMAHRKWGPDAGLPKPKEK